ncbi:hypothetical protein E3J79_02310 [Candidatus Dependentiae bacterium]|nr:MAG: hypothetical protein E3J79_02310 [Candidatus Dependentiae bacterium]
MKRSFYIVLLNALLVIFCINSTVNATVVAKGNTSDTTNSFTGTVLTKIFDRATGTIYVGVGGLEGDNAKYRLSKAIRLLGNEKPSFNPIGSQIDNTIEFLTLATQTGNTSPFLAFVEYASTSTKEQTKVRIINNTGTTVGDLINNADLKDASGATGVDGETTSGIVDIAANKSFIFAAVRPTPENSTKIDFGALDSGIAVVSINQTTLELQQTAATESDSGIKAKKLDLDTDEVKIQEPPIILNNTAELFWDDPLQRLYIGLHLTTTATADAGAKAVVVAYVNDNGVLTLSDVAPDDTFDKNVNTNIVGAITNGTQQKSITIKHIRVMHCSTEPSYLIVNGGNGDHDSINNLIFALPLVDKPSDEQIHGTIADKNSSLINFKFVEPATQNSHLPLQGESAVDVGAGPLSIQSSTPLSDIVVIGDTVYVSVNTTPDANNDSGVFYSHALFDETGKIVRWTTWAKRTLPINAFPNTPSSKGRIKFFDVDAVTSKLWAVEGTIGKAVCSTAWDFGTTSNSLPTQLNQVFNTGYCNKGCFSVLDLDQSTRGFSNDSILTTTNRYALFGGAEKVVFARISTAYDTTTTSPQEVIEDFSKAENFLVTELGHCCGCVNILEYSRSTTANYNYFFAGTECGLFVFANTLSGEGFSVEELGLFNAAPFIESKWHYIKQLQGSVIDIKSLGNRLYIIMFETSCKSPLKSKLYGIYFKDNKDTLFDQINISLLAESGNGIFQNAHLFTGMEIIATGSSNNPLNKEQLILVTNDGLFYSDATQTDPMRGIIDATNQTDANWQLLVSQPYWDITAPDAPIPSTFWPITIQDKADNYTYERSSIEQLNGSWGTSSLEFGFIPLSFNALSTAQAFKTLDPITHFWSDGARRFFITRNTNDPYCINKLLSFPYNTKEWNIVNPGQHIIFDPAVQVPNRFYWVHHIGASGILMAGTNLGVVALE